MAWQERRGGWVALARHMRCEGARSPLLSAAGSGRPVHHDDSMAGGGLGPVLVWWPPWAAAPSEPLPDHSSFVVLVSMPPCCALLCRLSLGVTALALVAGSVKIK